MQLPLQSLAEHDAGRNELEQHFDQHPALVWQPRQNQCPATTWHASPLLALQWIPHAPQSAALVVWVG
jgi:hypothetical protein